MTEYEKAWQAHLKRQNIIPPNEQTFRHGWNACLQMARAAALEGTEDAQEAAKAKDATDYVAGYQDACVDLNEHLRMYEIDVYHT